MTEKTWSGRFEEPVDQLVKVFTASVSFDKALAPYDIAGSKAHAAMLAKVGVLSERDRTDIVAGLERIAAEIDAGAFPWNIDDEDVHLNIEKRLTAMIGDAGKRLHTARSRNDQVATDLRLYLRDQLDELMRRVMHLERQVLEAAQRHRNVVMPGFTHLQVAQPITFGHHLMAYFEMFFRDLERLRDCRRRVNLLPLGSGALAGTTYPVDREFVASELGFDGLCENSLDAVSDRDFALEFLGTVSILLMHFSRLAEEVILWMSPRFGFVDIPDRFCTGSSIMPQKRNPDVLEIIRAKTGRTLGNYVSLMTVMKGQPLAYNHDNQEDKEPLFDSVDTSLVCTTLVADVIACLTPNVDQMRRSATEGFSTATDLADYLVKRGVPFRDAHEIVARIVLHAEKSGLALDALSLDTLRAMSPAIDDTVFAVLTPEGSVDARRHVGGTAPAQVARAIDAGYARLKTLEHALEQNKP